MKYIIALLFSLLVYPASAQQYPLEYDTLRTRVVALSGLNIRSQPDLKTEIIGGVPFMEEVELLEPYGYGRDTIAEHVYYNYYNEYTYTYYQKGEWVKIRYGNLNGYVFNAYLLYLPKEPSHSISGLNKDFGLNYIGSHCFDNVYRDKHLKWKGLYRSKDGFIIKPVEINYYADLDYSEHSKYHLTSLRVYVENNKDLLFVIGDKKGLITEGIVQGEVDYNIARRTELTINSVEHSLYDYDDLDVVFEEKSGYVFLYLKQGSQKQLLNPKIMNLNNPVNIFWRGDLDGDGADDYIINYGEKSAYSILYLSSQAKEGEIVKPVAVFFSGYCC